MTIALRCKTQISLYEAPERVSRGGVSMSPGSSRSVENLLFSVLCACVLAFPVAMYMRYTRAFSVMEKPASEADSGEGTPSDRAFARHTPVEPSHSQKLLYEARDRKAMTDIALSDKTTPSPPVPPHLTGTLITPTSKIAILEFQESRICDLTEGDSSEGWVVMSIHRGRVLISATNQRMMTVELTGSAAQKAVAVPSSGPIQSTHADDQILRTTMATIRRRVTQGEPAT